MTTMRMNIQCHDVHESAMVVLAWKCLRRPPHWAWRTWATLALHDPTSGTGATVPLQTGAELARVALWSSTPPHIRGWWEGQFAACFTMWESTSIPEAFRENIHNLDRIIVPSVQNQELFSRYHPDVCRVALGINPEWGYRPRPPIEREFRFLSAGYGPA